MTRANPYDEEDIAELRSLYADDPNDQIARLVATIDKKTREESEIRRRLVAMLSVAPSDDMPLYDESGFDVIRCVETTMRELITVVLAKPVDCVDIKTMPKRR